MARELTESEKEHYKDLENNFEKHVEEYRKKKTQELLDGKQAELEKELEHMQDYLDGCQRGEIDDLKVNIDFIGQKVLVLNDLLEH